MNEILQRTPMRLREKSWKRILSAGMQIPGPGPYRIKYRFHLAKAVLIDWQMGCEELEEICASQYPNGLIPLFSDPTYHASTLRDFLHPPTLGFALLKIYQSCKNKEKAKGIARQFFSKILHYHHYIYENRDMLGDGLIQTRFPYESPDLTEASLSSTQLFPNHVHKSVYRGSILQQSAGSIQ